MYFVLDFANFCIKNKILIEFINTVFLLEKKTKYKSSLKHLNKIFKQRLTIFCLLLLLEYEKTKNAMVKVWVGHRKEIFMIANQEKTHTILSFHAHVLKII